MILVSAFYVVTWMPMGVFYLVVWVGSDVAFNADVLNVLTFVMFFYMCANPFIYATKFNPVKQILVALIPCRRRSQQPADSMEMPPTDTARNRAVRYRN